MYLNNILQKNICVDYIYGKLNTKIRISNFFYILEDYVQLHPLVLRTIWMLS